MMYPGHIKKNDVPTDSTRSTDSNVPMPRNIFGAVPYYVLTAASLWRLVLASTMMMMGDDV